MYSHDDFLIDGVFLLSGTGQIWLDDIQCTGSETSLEDCSHRGWGVHNCGHVEDVGIECTTDGRY